MVLSPDAGAPPRQGGIPGIGLIVGMLPDGGLASALGDSGVADVVCGPKVKLGGSCATDTLPCVLSNLGGVCACVSGRYLCPTDTKSGPKPCPATVATGTICLSPMSICIAADTACLCGAGTYACL
jgi:hypothetical protein